MTNHLILSDLHNEFSVFKPDVEERSVDVIILAGDIDKGSKGIYWARGQWPNKEIIYVAGNHEFYGKIRGHVLAELRIVAKETGVHFLENEQIIINGIRYLGCTLWTDFKLFGEEFELACMSHAIQVLNDFRVIYEGDKIFSPMDSVKLFNESYKYLQESLISNPHNRKTVVITHHLPSNQSIASRFKKDMLSTCFASNIDHLLGYSEVWIHGHTHDSFDYTIKGTRVVCNPRGYLINNTQENVNFKPTYIISI
jgi:predicted phosphodiesterase